MRIADGVGEYRPGSCPRLCGDDAPAQFSRQTHRHVRTGRRARPRASANRARRSTLRSRQPRVVRDRRLELPPGSHRCRRSTRRRRRSCGGGRVPIVRGADSRPRLGHEPRRPELQRRRRARLHEVHESHSRGRLREAHRTRAAGRHSRHASQPRRRASPDVRPRSLDA